MIVKAGIEAGIPVPVAVNAEVVQQDVICSLNHWL